MSQNISTLLVVGIFGSFASGFGIYEGFSIYQWYQMLNHQQETIGEYNYAELTNYNDSVNKEYLNKIQTIKTKITKNSKGNIKFQEDIEQLKKQNIQLFEENLENYQKKVIESKRFFDRDLFSDILQKFDQVYIIDTNDLKLSILGKSIRGYYDKLLVQQLKKGNDKYRDEFLKAINDQRKLLQHEFGEVNIQDYYQTYAYIFGKLIHRQTPTSSEVFKNSQIYQILDFQTYIIKDLALKIKEKSFENFLDEYFSKNLLPPSLNEAIQKIKTDINSKNITIFKNLDDFETQCNSYKNIKDFTSGNTGKTLNEKKKLGSGKGSGKGQQLKRTDRDNLMCIIMKFCKEFLNYACQQFNNLQKKIQANITHTFDYDELKKQIEKIIKAYLLINKSVSLITKTNISIDIKIDDIDLFFKGKKHIETIDDEKYKSTCDDIYKDLKNFKTSLTSSTADRKFQDPNIYWDEIKEYIQNMNKDCYQDIVNVSNHSIPEENLIDSFQFERNEQIHGAIHKNMKGYIQYIKEQIEVKEPKDVQKKFYSTFLDKINTHIYDEIESFLFNKIKDQIFINNITYLAKEELKRIFKDTLEKSSLKSSTSEFDNFKNKIDKIINGELVVKLKKKSFKEIIEDEYLKERLFALVSRQSYGLFDLDDSKDYQDFQSFFQQKKFDEIIDNPQDLVKALIDKNLDQIKNQMKKRVQTYTSLNNTKIQARYSNPIFENLIQKQKDKITIDELTRNKKIILNYSYNYNVIIQVQKLYIENTQNIILYVIRFQKILISFQYKILLQVHKGLQLVQNIQQNKKLVNFDNVREAIRQIYGANQQKELEILTTLTKYKYQNTNKMNLTNLYLTLTKIKTNQTVENMSRVFDILISRGEVFNRNQITDIGEQKQQIINGFDSVKEVQDNIYICYINFVYSVLTGQSNFTTDYFFRDLEDVLSGRQARKLFDLDETRDETRYYVPYETRFEENQFLKQSDIDNIKDFESEHNLEQIMNLLEKHSQKQNFNNLVINFKNVLLFNADKQLQNSDYRLQSNSLIKLPNSSGKPNFSYLQFYGLLANLQYLNQKQQLFKFYLTENNSLHNEYKLSLATKNFIEIKSDDNKYPTYDNKELTMQFNGKCTDYLKKDIQSLIDFNIKQQDVMITFQTKCIEMLRDTEDFASKNVFQMSTMQTLAGAVLEAEAKAYRLKQEVKPIEEKLLILTKAIIDHNAQLQNDKIAEQTAENQAQKLRQIALTVLQITQAEQELQRLEQTQQLQTAQSNLYTLQTTPQIQTQQQLVHQLQLEAMTTRDITTQETTVENSYLQVIKSEQIDLQQERVSQLILDAITTPEITAQKTQVEQLQLKVITSEPIKQLEERIQQLRLEAMDTAPVIMQKQQQITRLQLEAVTSTEIDQQKQVIQGLQIAGADQNQIKQARNQLLTYQQNVLNRKSRQQLKQLNRQIPQYQNIYNDIRQLRETELAGKSDADKEALNQRREIQPQIQQLQTLKQQELARLKRDQPEELQRLNQTNQDIQQASEQLQQLQETELAGKSDADKEALNLRPEIEPEIQLLQNLKQAELDRLKREEPTQLRESYKAEDTVKEQYQRLQDLRETELATKTDAEKEALNLRPEIAPQIEELQRLLQTTEIQQVKDQIQNLRYVVVTTPDIEEQKKQIYTLRLNVLAALTNQELQALDQGNNNIQSAQQQIKNSAQTDQKIATEEKVQRLRLAAVISPGIERAEQELQRLKQEEIRRLTTENQIQNLGRVEDNQISTAKKDVQNLKQQALKVREVVAAQEVVERLKQVVQKTQEEVKKAEEEQKLIEKQLQTATEKVKESEEKIQQAKNVKAEAQVVAK